MIDTDKYKGHNDAPWRTAEGQPYDDEGSHLDIVDANGVLVTETSYFTDNDHPNARLIADAPLLLAEVKRMNRFAHCAMNFMSKHDLHFQFLNEHGVYTAPDGGSISTFIPYSYKWDDETKVSSESIQFTVRGEEE